MIRGTTPTCTFTLPFDAAGLKTIRVTFAQSGKLLAKTGDDLTVDGSTIKVRLTQEETLSFSSDVFVEIQVKVMTDAGDVLASAIHRDYLGRILDEEVMV